MPHSNASLKRLIDWYTNEYRNELERTLGENDPKTLVRAVKLINLLRITASPREKIEKKLNACLSNYPALCNRIIGFHPFGAIRLKEAEPMPMQIPLTPPARFTRDTLSSIVPHLPFPVLGCLAKTCKWMNANITRDQVERALARCRELFRKVEIITEPSPSGRQMIRMFTANEEVIDVGYMHNQHPFVLLRIRGRTYMGMPSPGGVYYRGFGDLYNHVVYHVTSGIEAPEKQKPLIWVKYAKANHSVSDDSIHVRFFVNFGIQGVSNEVSMMFGEFVQ